MSFKLTILILTTEKTIPFYKLIWDELYQQTKEFPGAVNVLSDSGPEKIGIKRNRLLARMNFENGTKHETDYVCFIDDDDMVAPDYIKTILEAIEKNPDCDCLSLRGIITTDGGNPEMFEHSLKYTKWDDNGTKYPNIRYERYPNHLNVIRADIARQFKFLEVNRGEDHDWSTQIHKSGLLKNEVYIDKVLYYYQYRSNK